MPPLLLDFYLCCSRIKAPSYSRVIMVGGCLPGLPSPVWFPEKSKSSPQVFRGIATQGSGPHRSMGQAVICRINKERKQGREARLRCHVSTSDLVPMGPAVPEKTLACPCPFVQNSSHAN